MISVLSLPPLATIQDLGRDGYWGQGLGRAGAMDPFGHSLANLLLGNDVNAATLEIPLTPARFEFTAQTAFALAGAACGAHLGGCALPRVFAGVAQKGDQLAFGAMSSGARVYLALVDGIDVPKVLGSRSTQLREGFGGLEGRVLAQGDTLEPSSSRRPKLPQNGLSLSVSSPCETQTSDIVVRALPSTEYDSFTPKAITAFWSQPYTVTHLSNRQGYRLDGPMLDATCEGELRSHGIVPGIVQVPHGGQPIIQLADSATMGGYPKIAAIIEPDLWRIGQAKAGDTLRFKQADLEETAKAFNEQTSLLSQYQTDLDYMINLQQSWN